jgi:hypothetical protein
MCSRCLTLSSVPGVKSKLNHSSAGQRVSLESWSSQKPSTNPNIVRFLESILLDFGLQALCLVPSSMLSPLPVPIPVEEDDALWLSK